MRWARLQRQGEKSITPETAEERCVQRQGCEAVRGPAQTWGHGEDGLLLTENGGGRAEAALPAARAADGQAQVRAQQAGARAAAPARGRRRVHRGGVPHAVDARALALRERPRRQLPGGCRLRRQPRLGGLLLLQ